MQVYKEMRSIISIVCCLVVLSSCMEDRVIYKIEKDTLYQDASEKKNIKTAQEFISIAYSDIFGKDIDYNTLENIGIPYTGFGDKELMEDLIIKNFLKDPEAQIPINDEMRNDIEGFVREVYVKFYSRNPNEFEAWRLKQYIEDDPELTPEIIYYSILISQEYRYY